MFAGTMVDIFGNFGNLITQTTVSLFVVTILLMVLGYVASRKIEKRPGGLQVLVEKVLNMLYQLVEDTMGKHNLKFAPYIGTLFLSCMIGSLIGTTAIFRSTTADFSVTLAYALVTSVMVWYHNIKQNGFIGWLKGFTEPIFVMTPMNLISEIAQPMAMAFRHFGNVAGGSVLTTLIYAALALGSKAFFSLIFGWLPAHIIGLLPPVFQAGIPAGLPAHIIELLPPVFQAGIPAFLSLYFDFFSSFVQAFVFCLLTMVYVAGACPPPAEEKSDANK